MAQKVLILGSSGTGKSTSIRNLNPDETFIIKAVEKQLPFKKSETLYNSENKNIFTTQKINSVLSMLDRIEKNSKVKTLIIDDFNYLLTFGYKEKAKENRMIQQFFKNKVFWGIDSVPLKRKIYRGKRDKNGSRKNECFYVSEDQKYRI